jgi:hypothetical protein
MAGIPLCGSLCYTKIKKARRMPASLSFMTEIPLPLQQGFQKRSGFL